MSHQHRRGQRDRVRFPRVSGDEPDYVSGKMEGIKFSPRERG